MLRPGKISRLSEVRIIETGNFSVRSGDIFLARASLGVQTPLINDG